MLESQGADCPLFFGSDVAIRGDRAIAAMTGSGCEGRIAVFERNSFGVWQRSGTIVAQPVSGSGSATWTLALGESRAFIGSDCGFVQAFRVSGNEWLFEETFAGGYCTGTRLAFDQGWLVLSNPSESAGLPPEFGVLSLWQRRNGTWTPAQSLSSSPGERHLRANATRSRALERRAPAPASAWKSHGEAGAPVTS